MQVFLHMHQAFGQELGKVAFAIVFEYFNYFTSDCTVRIFNLHSDVLYKIDLP